MSETPPTYGDREKTLADFSDAQIASGIADALQDLVGEIYEVEVVHLQRHPNDQADMRVWVRRVDDSEIPDKEG